jgi:hypothetical protein
VTPWLLLHGSRLLGADAGETARRRDGEIAGAEEEEPEDPDGVCGAAL